MTEVVHAAGPEQRRFQLVAGAGRRPRAPHQGRQPGPQRRIQPFAIRGVAAPQFDLGCLHDCFGADHAPIGQPSRDADQPAPDPLLHHLHNVQVIPHHQPRAPGLARVPWVTKHLHNDTHIGFEAIHRKQDRLPRLRGGAHVLDDRPDQGLVALPTESCPRATAAKRPSWRSPPRPVRLASWYTTHRLGPGRRRSAPGRPAVPGSGGPAGRLCVANRRPCAHRAQRQRPPPGRDSRRRARPARHRPSRVDV